MRRRVRTLAEHWELLNEQDERVVLASNKFDAENATFGMEELPPRLQEFLREQPISTVSAMAWLEYHDGDLDQTLATLEEKTEEAYDRIWRESGAERPPRASA